MQPAIISWQWSRILRALPASRRNAKAAPPAGVKLFREGKDAGQITSAVLSPRCGVIALAYVRRGSDTAGTTLDVDLDGSRQAAVVSSLPFGG